MGRGHGHVAVGRARRDAGAGLPQLYDDFFEPFWSACEDLGLVVSAHAGYGGTATEYGRPEQAALSDDHGVAERFETNTDEDGHNSDKIDELMDERSSPIRLGLQQPRRVMWQLMAGGVFDRHPASGRAHRDPPRLGARHPRPSHDPVRGDPPAG